MQNGSVIIVGAGPVGLALAVALARLHIPSTILEARAAPTPADQSRAITWMPKGLEFRDSLELLEPFLQQGTRRIAHEFRSSTGRLL